jgi:hypothetical protein
MVHLLGFDAHLIGLLVRGSVVVKADLGVAAEGSRTPSANAIDSKSRCNKVVSTFIINNYHPFKKNSYLLSKISLAVSFKVERKQLRIKSSNMINKIK